MDFLDPVEFVGPEQVQPCHYIRNTLFYVVFPTILK